MSYIGRDGTVYHGVEPWGWSKITRMFYGLINIVMAFFTTLIPGLAERGPSSHSSGWGSGPRAPPPPGPRRRNIRGFGSVSDVQPPPCGGGG